MDQSPQILKQIIAGNIRKYRKQLGLSQEALADLCNLHRTYIGSVERRERNVTITTLCTIANALGITVIDLLSQNEKV